MAKAIRNGAIVMTYELAMACGKDAANAQMRKAGRSKWDRSDYNLAAKTFNRLYSIEDHFAELRAR